MSKTYSAGIVTAYGAAKRAGYQGTYEDFCRQQAGYAESAATVEQAKNTAVSAANTATTKAGEASTAATAAQTAKTQTEAAASQALTKASEASASATSAGQSATNAAASATSAANAASAAQGVLDSIPEDYSDLSRDVDDSKADLTCIQDFDFGILDKAFTYKAQFLLDSNRTTGYIRTTTAYNQYQVNASGAYWEGFYAPAGTYYYGTSISGARSYVKNLVTGEIVKLNTLSSASPVTIPYDSICYITSNNYSSGSWFGTQAEANGESGIYGLSCNIDDPKVSHKITINTTGVGTQFRKFKLYNGHYYRVIVESEEDVSVNVRVGYGTTQTGSLATGLKPNHQYFVQYAGTEYENVLVAVTGACVVTIEDLDTVDSQLNGRHVIEVDNVEDFIRAVNFSNTHKCTINMMPGTYDLISGLGSDYFANAPASNFGLILGNDVIINGSPTAKITAVYTGDNDNVKQYFSPFNAGKCVSPYVITGGYTLNDVWLSGRNIRYLVHDEHNGDTVPYRNVYRNCYFYLDNSENTVWNNHQTIGGGLGVSGTIDITGCIFEGTPHDARTAVLGYHNCKYSEDAQSYINFCDNVLTPTNAIIYLGASGPSQHKTKVLLGNNLWGGVYSKNVGTYDNMDVIAWNNVALQ